METDVTPPKWGSKPVSNPIQISMISTNSHDLIFDFLDVLFGECASFDFFFHLKLLLKNALGPHYTLATLLLSYLFCL